MSDDSGQNSHTKGFGTRVRRVQERFSRDVTAFAEQLDVSRSTVYDWFKLEVPSHTAIGAIVSNFPTVSVEWLKTGTGEMIHSKPDVPALEGEERTIRVGMVAVSAGDGAVPERVSTVYVSEEQFVHDFHRSPPESGHAQNQWYAKIEGDSMAPELFDGEIVPIEIVDLPIREVRTSDLYIIYYAGHVHARRVQFEVSGRVHLKCTNPNYDNEVVELDEASDIRVIAKIRQTERDQLVGAMMRKVLR